MEGRDLQNSTLPTSRTHWLPTACSIQLSSRILACTQGLWIYEIPLVKPDLGHQVRKHQYFIKSHHLEISLGSLIGCIIIIVTFSTNCLFYTVISKLLWITKYMSNVIWSQIIHQKYLITNTTLQPFNTIPIGCFRSQIFTVMFQNSFHVFIFLRSLHLTMFLLFNHMVVIYSFRKVQKNKYVWVQKTQCAHFYVFEIDLSSSIVFCSCKYKENNTSGFATLLIYFCVFYWTILKDSNSKRYRHYTFPWTVSAAKAALPVYSFLDQKCIFIESLCRKEHSCLFAQQK